MTMDENAAGRRHRNPSGAAASVCVGVNGTGAAPYQERRYDAPLTSMMVPVENSAPGEARNNTA
jgi:hypothetical protein